MRFRQYIDPGLTFRVIALQGSWEPTIKYRGMMPGIVLRVDGKGRITLPKEFREKYDIGRDPA